jgi:hypothetical protein
VVGPGDWGLTVDGSELLAGGAGEVLVDWVRVWVCTVVVTAGVAAEADVCADDDVTTADPVGAGPCSVFEHDAVANAATTVARIMKRRIRRDRIGSHASVPIHGGENSSPSARTDRLTTGAGTMDG